MAYVIFGSETRAPFRRIGPVKNQSCLSCTTAALIAIKSFTRYLLAYVKIVDKYLGISGCIAIDFQPGVKF